MNLLIKKDALFNKNKTKRFLLTRSWSDGKKQNSCVFVMLNPSNADSKNDDPTVKKCIHYSNMFGHNKLSVINLFPQISTVPRLKDFSFCKKNHSIVKEVISKNEFIYLAWGFNFKIKKWLKRILENKRVYALEMSKNNTPKHPLYLKKNLEPIPIYF